jgi:hypothetical protein
METGLSEGNIINCKGGNSVTQKSHAQNQKNLEKQVSKMQQEINRLKKTVYKKNISSPRKSNLLQSVDPAKISEWLSIFSNPAVMEVLNQITSKPAPAEPPAVPRRRRRRFLF